MDLLIHDATVVTQDNARRVLHDAAILVRGDRIAAVGDSDTLLAAHPDAATCSRSSRGLDLERREGSDWLQTWSVA